MLGALVLPARDQWRAGAFAWQTWNRLHAAGRISPASELDQRLAQLRAALAQSRVAGLVLSTEFNELDVSRLKYQTQYALAPTIVLPGTDAEFVVVIGRRGAATAEPDAAAFELQQSFDEYLRLYRRRR